MICVEEIRSNYFTLLNAVEVSVWAAAVHESIDCLRSLEDMTRLHRYGSRREGVPVFVVDRN